MAKSSVLLPNEAIWHFQRRSPNSSGFSQTTQHVLPISKRRAGKTASYVPTVTRGREPVRLKSRPGVLTCRKCRKQTSLTVDTVMERTHSPLTTWFWGAYLVSSLTPGLSAVQFQRQIGLSRYETAFQILHKLRAGMMRPDRGQSVAILGAAIISRLTTRGSVAHPIAGPTALENRRLSSPRWRLYSGSQRNVGAFCV